MRKLHDIPAFTRIREICLAFPDTTETQSWGHPNFRVGRKAYLTLEMHADRPVIAFRLAMDQVGELCKSGRFHPTPYGRGQWASMYADGRLNWRHVQSLARQSYRLAAEAGSGR